MKYILIISVVYPPEPVVSAKLSADLYHALKNSGRQVKVLHPKPTRPNGFNFDKEIQCGPDEVTTNSFVCPQMSKTGRMRESWSFGEECSKYIKDHHGEISCIYANSWPMFSQKAIVKASMKYAIPCLIHVQDVYPESLTNKMTGLMGKLVHSVFLPLDRYILKNSSRIIAISEKMRTYLSQSREIDCDKISVVINWQDEKDFISYQEQHAPEVHDRFTFMYMGNIGPVAGVDLLIDAFVKAQMDNASLVIAGSGSMKESLKEKASLHKNIEFWDVPNGKVPEIQSKADVMLLPIKKGAASSSIPSKLPAYMFSAKPIIGCVDEDSDTAEAIRGANCGWVIEPEDPDKLAKAMRMAVALDGAILGEYAKHAQQYGLKHFSKMENLKKLVSIIEEVL